MGVLRSSDVHWVVHHYIGVAEGFLGDFSYRTHREFYPGFCDLQIDPDAYTGSTRERFIQILGNADGPSQAAILRGVLKRFPMGSEDCRTAASAKDLRLLIRKCSDSAAVDVTNPRITSEIVHRALADAQILLERSSPTSAVDRVHTAMHAYLKAVCATCGVEPGGDSITALFKQLRQHHPQLSQSHHADTMNKILQSLSNIIDTLNPARNHGSLAHPNEHLLDKDDALLVINSARTVLQYLNAKL